jgi:hypothetical protein
MSRGASMQRQGSAAGGKPGDAVGTPGKMMAAATAAAAAAKQPGAAGGTPQLPMEDPWAGSTIDPQDLFSGLERSLETVTGGFVPDFGTYRSLTPNDTPESSKDSGVSEGTSDIAEHMVLDIDLAVQPLDGDLLWDMDNITMDNFDAAAVGLGGGGEMDMDMYLNDSSVLFSLDELQSDFSKPWKVDQSLYSTMDLQ